MKYKTQKGFTLIELMIAIFIMATGILSVYALIPHSMEVSAVNTDKYIATQLAREGIEIIRNIRDTNWIEQLESPFIGWFDDLTSCAGGCEVDYTTPTAQNPILPLYGSGRYLLIDANGFYNYTSGDPTKFKRKVTITVVGGGLQTEVAVSWSLDYPDAVLEETFYNWK